MTTIEEIIEEFEFSEEEAPRVLELLEFINTFVRLNGNIKTMDMLEEMISELR